MSLSFDLVIIFAQIIHTVQILSYLNLKSITPSLNLNPRYFFLKSSSHSIVIRYLWLMINFTNLLNSSLSKVSVNFYLMILSPDFLSLTANF